MIEELVLKNGKENGGRLKLDNVELKKYKVIQCPNCGNISSCMSNITFKCIFCNKSRKIKKVKEFGLSVKVLKSFDDPREATNYCRVAKDVIQNKGELTKAGFYNAGDVI